MLLILQPVLEHIVHGQYLWQAHLDLVDIQDTPAIRVIQALVDTQDLDTQERVVFQALVVFQE